MRRRLGGTQVECLPCTQGELFEPRGEFQPQHGGVGAATVSSLGQMGFEVLSLPSFFAPAKKEGRRPGELRRALSK